MSSRATREQGWPHSKKLARKLDFFSPITVSGRSSLWNIIAGHRAASLDTLWPTTGGTAGMEATAVVGEVQVGEDGADTDGAAMEDTAITAITGTDTADISMTAVPGIGATAPRLRKRFAVWMGGPIQPTKICSGNGIWVRSRCTLTTSSPMHTRRPVGHGCLSKRPGSHQIFTPRGSEEPRSATICYGSLRALYPCPVVTLRSKVMAGKEKKAGIWGSRSPASSCWSAQA